MNDLNKNKKSTGIIAFGKKIRYWHILIAIFIAVVIGSVTYYAYRRNLEYKTASLFIDKGIKIRATYRENLSSLEKLRDSAKNDCEFKLYEDKIEKLNEFHKKEFSAFLEEYLGK